MNKEIKPLYRKVNTKARNCHHNKGGDARHDRNTKAGLKRPMKKDVNRGLDYTPLYMFLLSKVGQDFTAIHKEALSRLDSEDAIYHLVLTPEVIRQGHGKYGYVNCGESSRYSALFIDEDNTLQKLMPNLTNEQLYPSCHCCTHTFNGKPLVKTYDDFNLRYKEIS